MSSCVKALGLVAALGLAGVIACGEEPPPPAPVARPIKILEVGGDSGGGAREYPGEISAASNTQVAFEVAGKLVEFPVRESQKVQRGDLLARLDPRDYEEKLNAAQASSGAARADFERYQALYRENVASKQQLEKAARDYDVFVAREATARKALEDSNLRAPFDGVVARKLVDDFANVQAKEPVVTLQTGADLEIVVNLPEQDYVNLKPGITIDELNLELEVYVVVSAVPGRKFSAVLKEFATTADPVTRTFAATFSFDSPDDVSVLPGMTAKVVGVGPRSQAEGAAIPVHAAAEDESGKPFVWVVDPDSMEVRKAYVTLGRLRQDGIEVVSGLQVGDWVATSGVQQLREGMQVRRMGS